MKPARATIRPYYPGCPAGTNPKAGRYVARELDALALEVMQAAIRSGTRLSHGQLAVILNNPEAREARGLHGIRSVSRKKAGEIIGHLGDGTSASTPAGNSWQPGKNSVSSLFTPSQGVNEAVYLEFKTSF